VGLCPAPPKTGGAMAISTYRAPRNTEDLFVPKWSANPNVGPGSYTNDYHDIKPSSGERLVPFNSLAEKKMNQNTGTSAITPGPGAYIGGKAMELADTCAGSVGIKSKSRRMAPTAPGSTLFVTSTIVQNPGPGTYKQDGFAHGKGKKAELMLPVKPVLEAREPTVPSVPIMKLLPGQKPRTDDADVAVMVMRHTGERGDTCGPGEYDPRANEHGRSVPAAKFGASQDSRSLWEPSIRIENRNLAPWDNPGPGSYDAGARAQDKSAVGSSGFASKTPMCYDTSLKAKKGMPGPGTYDVQADFDKNAKTAVDRGMTQMELLGFGSMTERESTLARSSGAPYKDPYNVREVPGPGRYEAEGVGSAFPNDVRKKEIEKVLPDHGQRKLHGVHHPTIVMALQENIGPLHAFFSTDQRPCNKRDEGFGPSPGEYALGSARGYSMEANLRERAKVGRKGVFGTSADRFKGGPLDSKTDFGDASMALASGQDTHDSPGGELPMSSFTSHTPRFRGPPASSEPHVTLVGKHESPAPGTYVVEKEPNYRSPFRHARVEHLSFGSCKDRFGAVDFHFKETDQKPGPGAYNARLVQKHLRGSPRTTAGRMDQAQACGTTEAVGPGSYSDGLIPTGLLKKTFNVSIAAPVVPEPGARGP